MAVMTDEHKSAIQAAKREAEERVRQDRLNRSMDFPPYRVYVFDSENWAVEKDDDEGTRKYFPSVDWCLMYVLNQQISDKCRIKVTDLRAVIQEAEKTMESIAKKYVAQA